MAHEYTIRLQVLSDDTFRIVTTDGNGKYTYGKVYGTTDTNAMYELAETIDSDEYRTRDECTVIARNVRKQLSAVIA